MATRMLIDAAHEEETRVVIVKGNRLEEFDFEVEQRKPLKGNIYLAKVTRVEPSLQAAFVDFGGNRHGFLAFNEIHPDYYQIPVADREALLAQQRAEEARYSQEDDEEVEELEVEEDDVQDDDIDDSADDAPDMADASDDADDNGEAEVDAAPAEEAEQTAEENSEAEIAEAAETEEASEEPEAATEAEAADEATSNTVVEARAEAEPVLESETTVVDEDATDDGDTDEATADTAETADDVVQSDDEESSDDDEENDGEEDGEQENGEGRKRRDGRRSRRGRGRNRRRRGRYNDRAAEEDDDSVDDVGGDELEDEVQRRRRSPSVRPYKIQEVIKRRQILLVQVVKEERGNKGAALTTYLSLPGRYCVLMPNTARGGGISRKISNVVDRKRLKSIMKDMEVPDGTGVIVRTAGAKRTRLEIRRDFDFLLKLWDDIRDKTLQSTAPALVYEEASLITRSIRDLYSQEIDEVLVEGETGYRQAKDFMKRIMPSHAKKVQPYRDRIPLLHRYQIDDQLDTMYNPEVTLPSGGYIVINPTEALVAIDVNSGKSTKGRSIEETATRTNLEAAEEVARQLRLRDLAGLIVIDFIDMEESRNNRAVERKMKEALKSDRARIQVGRISHFGLLEMSRQRLRPGVLDVNTAQCPMCNGTGIVRSIDSTALLVLRAVEEEGIRDRSAEIRVVMPTEVAIYIMNKKRDALMDIEQRYGFRVELAADQSMVPPDYRIERIKNKTAADRLEEDTADADEDAQATENGQAENGNGNGEGDENRDKPKRRRRRRRKSQDRDQDADANGAPQDEGAEGADEEKPADADGENAETRDGDEEGGSRRRRRGRRGGRRRRGKGNEDGQTEENQNDEEGAESTEIEVDQPSDDTVETSEPVAAADAEAETSQPTEAEEAVSEEAEPETAEVAEAETNPADDTAEETAETTDEPDAEAAAEEAVDGEEPPQAEAVEETPAAVEETEAEAVTEAEAEAGSDDGAGDAEPVEADAPEEVAETAETDAAAAEPETAAEPQAEKPEEPPKPKRFGWWSRS